MISEYFSSLDCSFLEEHFLHTLSQANVLLLKQVLIQFCVRLQRQLKSLNKDLI